MAKKIKIENPLQKVLENHKKPRTRREFVGLGLASASGYVLAPSVLDILFAQQAYGANCAGNNLGPASTGFLVFDLMGGANIAGSNVMVGKAGGQKDFIASYKSLGLPDAIARNVDESAGLVFHANSAMLKGLKAGAEINGDPMAVLQHVDGAVFCTSSADDTSNNPHSPIYWINAAGARGQLQDIIALVSSESGGRAIVPPESVNPQKRPVRISSSLDAQNLVSLGKLTQIMDADKTQKILKAVESMSAAQLGRFKDKDLPAQVKELIQCGYINTNEMVARFQDPASLDATLDPLTNQAFPSYPTYEYRQTAIISKLIIDGNAGVGTIVVGGCDYHDATRTTGDVRDESIGRLIGQSLKHAHLKQKNLVIYVYSDGGVVSNGNTDSTGKGVWVADSGVRSAAFMLVYKAGAGKPLIRDTRQIGHYSEAGAVASDANKASSNIVNLSKAVVANYLALHGREGELAKIVGDDPFGPELDRYLAFQKLV